MFLLYWEVYVLMNLVVNFRNENLDQFCGTRTFIDISVYMRFIDIGVYMRFIDIGVYVF